MANQHSAFGFASYLQTLYQHTKGRLPLALGLLLAAGLTEGIGLMLLIPLLASIGLDMGTGINTNVAMHMQNALAALHIPLALAPLLSIFLLLIAARSMLSYFRDTYLYRMQLEFVDALAVSLHKAFGKAQWSFLMRQRNSDFTHVLTKDVFRIGIGTQLFLQAVVSISLISAYLLTSLYLSPYLTLLVIAAGALLLWLLRGYRRRASQLGKEQTQTGKAVFASVNEFLGGIKLVKSYGAEAHYLRYFKQSATAQRHKQLAFRRNSSLAQQSFQVGSALLLCLFFYVAIEVMQVAMSQLLVLTLIFVRLMPLLSGLQRNYEQVTHMLPAYAAAMQLKQDCAAAAEPELFSAAAPVPLRLQQSIELEKVSFAYNKAVPVLQQVTVSIPAQQTTALIGASGAGKSTLADLLAGLMLPERGQVLIDGVPLTTQNLQNWRKQVAYVPQDVFLFHDTLRANMSWIDPNVPDDKLWQVLELAAAKAFVEKLPQGLDTVIGERGIRLSGGERQRIALARALLREPDLLILDEATSALDQGNEQRIRDSLKRLHGSMTIVLIAHRMTTVASADRILEVKNGRVLAVDKAEVAGLGGEQSVQTQTA